MYTPAASRYFAFIAQIVRVVQPVASLEPRNEEGLAGRRDSMALEPIFRPVVAVAG